MTGESRIGNVRVLLIEDNKSDLIRENIHSPENVLGQNLKKGKIRDPTSIMADPGHASADRPPW